MAEPPYSATTGLTLQVIEQTPGTPDVTDPRIVTLYFNGFDGTSDAPVLKFIDDTGATWAFSVAADGAISGGTVPYIDNNRQYPSLLSMSADLLYMILNGNLILGREDGTGAVNRKIVFVTGAAGGTIELGANGADDGLQHLHDLPQTDPTAEGQVLAASSVPGGSTQWDFRTADVALASGIAVDLNITTKQVLYTVPTGRKCYITKVVMRDSSGSVTTAKAPFGFNANADNVLPAQDLSALTGGTIYQQFSVTSATEGAAADTFGTKLTVAQGAAMTATVDIFGYLV